MTEPYCIYFTLAVFCSSWDSEACSLFSLEPPPAIQVAKMARVARIGKVNWLFNDFFFKFTLKISDVKNTLNKHD